MRIFARTADGSLLEGDQVLYFSMERFIADISNGKCCLMCGRKYSPKKFNREHVIPDWILKRFDLYQKTVKLPNGFEIKYGTNTVPCCSECNAALGTKLEKPVSDMLTNGFDNFAESIETKLPLLFCWLCFLVFKNHYRDKKVRLSRLQSPDETKLSEIYAWEDLHHMHAVARSVLTGCKLTGPVIGSIAIFQFNGHEAEGHFDYVDLYPSQTVLVRVEDIAIVAALNDAGGVNNGFDKISKRITGAVSSMQLREILAHFAVINLHIKERPIFSTSVYPFSAKCEIVAKVPNLFQLNDIDPKEFGEIVSICCNDLLQAGSNPADDKAKKASLMKDGKLSFLFNADGSFNQKTSHSELSDSAALGTMQ